MEAKEGSGSDSPDDRHAAPYWEAFRVAGEALNSVYNPTIPHQQELHPVPPPALATAHRRSQSEVLSGGGGAHNRNGGFQKLKMQMQKAWRRGGDNRDQGYVPSFNPEVLADQKRQWYQLHSKAMDHAREPTSLFEYFIIVGLPQDANLEAVEDAFARRKKWELEMAGSEVVNFKTLQNSRPSSPLLEPQVLFKYPPGKRLAVRPKDLAAFCFPGGIKPWLPERTPSLSDLNVLVYGQDHLGRDDSAFIFSLRVGDNNTLYGVCLHVTEMVQRPPSVLGSLSPISQHSRRCRFLASAPRCYCLLTRVPFFELHYEMLNSIIAQDRLNRITQFVTEISLTSCLPSPSRQHDQLNENFGCLDKVDDVDWKAYAIPIDSAVALTAAAAGILPEDDTQTLSTKLSEPNSPESVTASEASEQAREVDKDCRKNAQNSDDCASESSETHSDCLERIYGSYENGLVSPETGMVICSKNLKLERLGSFDTLFSPVRSMGLEDEDDDFFSNYESDLGDNIIMEWARENKNDLLQIVCSYHAMPLVERGSQLTFQPLQHLQAIEYKRPSVSDISFGENFLAYDAADVNVKLAAAEEACALSIWTTATICRVLSLESVLALFGGVLLEKQVVVVCSNLGILSATVLSIIPMIRPFQWQSLLLPILPSKMFDFLDAPVPFIVGINHKPAQLKMKTLNLVHVNVEKDQVKTCQLPALPRYKELVSELQPIHDILSLQSSVARRQPIYKCNEEQAQAATLFLTATRRYLESLCSDLGSHTITSVQSNNDRVSLLLKDSFVDSFPSKDRPFIKQFVETQQFSVLSDSRLSPFESRRF